MEEILLYSLKAQHQKLLAVKEQTDSLLSNDTIYKEDLMSSQILLKNLLTQFTLEFNNCINKITCPDLVLFKTYSDDKIEIEALLSRIDIMLNLYNSDNSTAYNDKYTHSRLPQLDLTKFNGNILSWNSYWDRFEANVHNKNISNAEKLSYLLGSLEGTALQAIDGLETTNLNYNIAIDILKNRFGKPERVIDAHNEALQILTKAQPSGTSCRVTLNSIEKHLRILESKGENVDSSHLRVSILNKFPDNILYQVNLITANDTSIASIRRALDIVITALEKSEGSPSVSDAIDSLPKMATSVEALHIQAEDGRPNRKGKWVQPAQARKRPIKRNFQSSQSTQITDRKRKAFGQPEDSQPTLEKRGKLVCIFCNEQHYNDQCQKFSTVVLRKRQLKGKCFLCFRPGHAVKNCKVKMSCSYCKRQHNRALCFQKFEDKSGMQYNDNTLIHHAKCLTTHTKSYLQTATVTVKNGNIKENCRVLLDSGSQRTYMTTKMANKLNLTPDKDDFLIIYTFGSENPNKMSSPSAEVQMITKRGVQKIIRVNIVPHITDRVPVPNLNTSNLIDITADDTSMGVGIDLLIGNDYYFSFMKNEIVQISDNLHLVNTDLGWIVSGNIATNDNESDLSVITYCQCHGPECPYFTEPDLPLRNIDVKFLWNLESIGITDSPKTTREEEAVKHYNETVKYQNGRYEVKWPWIDYPPELPSNYGLAYGRLKSLLRRLDAEAIKDYENILEEQLKASMIEVVEPKPRNGDVPIHYLPHHIVSQPGKRGRIVYDASAKIKNQKSLNECLYKGPSMLEDMTALLLKFRTGKIALSADVEKAFLQVGLQEDDREVTRFLWVKDPTKELTEDNLIHLRFCRVPFGVISSPFLLTATIRYHLSKKNKGLLAEIADRCYVDNLLTTANSVKEATELYTAIRQVFDELSMNIREWTSNSDQFLENVPDIHQSKEQRKVKVLGLMWDREKDTLHLKTENIFESEEVTASVNSKREVLRMLARIYDPCGFVAPLVLPAKILFQELCINKLKWDEPLTKELRAKWQAIAEKIRESYNVEVPRYVGEVSSNEKGNHQLHCFADASKNAYAAVIYLRTSNGTESQTSFLMSKARVTPAEDKDDLKIPRLELLAFLIGNRLLKYVRENLGLLIDSSFLWTDSLIVLNWMKTNKLLPPFVARRITELKQNKDVQHCYINTNQNPADLATRPELWNQKKDLWFNGPEFLSKERKLWPHNMLLNEHYASCLAGEDLAVDSQEMTSVDGPETIDIDGPETFDIDGPETDQINEPSLQVPSLVEKIKRLQAEHYPEEVLGKETHLTRNLGVFLDVDGVLRCKGRMTHTDWTYDKKHPILIPTDCSFTKDVILETHTRHYHVGTSHTLSLIRQKFWIPRGRAQVQRVLKNCPQCVKHGGGPYKLPAVPPLPAERVNFSAPFTFTGIDYFGPMFVSTDKGNEKRWVCLYTCLAVRAVHLEVVNDLTATECLLALRRFTASRGIPKMIISDNALQFKLVSEIVSLPYCIENAIKWKFIPQLAPWHGGFYERMVALVKHCLKRTLDKHLLQDSQLLTLLKEVESVVNTRPLTNVGSELEHVLRPADFLSYGECLEMDSSDFRTAKSDTATKIGLIEGWKRGQKVLSEFRGMFQDQYLPSLRERYSQSYKQPKVTSKRVPQLGEIVQIKEDRQGRQNWKVGKIVSIIKGRDGEGRVAKVKVGETEFIRSLGHLYPLEVEQKTISDTEFVEQKGRDPVQDEPLTNFQLPELEADNIKPYYELPIGTVDGELSSSAPEQLDVYRTTIDESSMEEPSDETTHNPQAQPTRSVRDAAIRAREKIAEWTRQLMTLL